MAYVPYRTGVSSKFFNADNHITKSKRFCEKCVVWLYFVVDTVVVMTADMLTHQFWFTLRAKHLEILREAFLPRDIGLLLP